MQCATADRDRLLCMSLHASAPRISFSPLKNFSPQNLSLHSCRKKSLLFSTQKICQQTQCQYISKHLLSISPPAPRVYIIPHRILIFSQCFFSCFQVDKSLKRWNKSKKRSPFDARQTSSHHGFHHSVHVRAIQKDDEQDCRPVRPTAQGPSTCSCPTTTLGISHLGPVLSAPSSALTIARPTILNHSQYLRHFRVGRGGNFRRKASQRADFTTSSRDPHGNFRGSRSAGWGPVWGARLRAEQWGAVWFLRQEGRCMAARFGFEGTVGGVWLYFSDFTPGGFHHGLCHFVEPIGTAVALGPFRRITRFLNIICLR